MTNEEAIRLVDDRMCYGRGKWSRHHQPVIDEYWQAGEMAIKALEAEPHWIPVTERLPKEEGFYIVTLEHRYGAETNIRFFKIENGERYWSLWGNENITAWMPLPEPYKGVTE